MYGPNFVALQTVILGKYDPDAMAKDSLDARLTTFPHRKTASIGPFLIKPEANYFFGKNKDKRLVSLFISDPGATQDDVLPSDQPDHTDMREFLEKNFLGEKHIEAAIKRQSDSVGSKMLKQFGEDVKGLTNAKEVEAVVSKFLPNFLTYTLFDVDVDKIPQDAVNTVCTQGYFFNLFLPGTDNTKMKEAVEQFVDFIFEESKVLKNARDGPKGLSKRELCESIPMIFGVAAFAGTRDLASRPMTLMPEGYAETVVNDPEKLRNAILEIARLYTPVPFSGQVVDDKEGMTTVIGGKEIHFQKGTPFVSCFAVANVDEKRFPNPFVFDPENRDFSLLTSFNSVGETTYEPSPHICPGRNAAISAAGLMLRAKIEAESYAFTNVGTAE